MHSKYGQPMTLDNLPCEFLCLCTLYATRQPFPTIKEALDEVHMVIHEIEMCLDEGHTPMHHDIVWRVAFLMFCMQQVEHLGQRDDSARGVVARFLERLGVPVACAVEIGIVRLRGLNSGEDIEHIDLHILIPIMKRYLQPCP